MIKTSRPNWRLVFYMPISPFPEVFLPVIAINTDTSIRAYSCNSWLKSKPLMHEYYLLLFFPLLQILWYNFLTVEGFNILFFADYVRFALRVNQYHVGAIHNEL